MHKMQHVKKEWVQKVIYVFAAINFAVVCGYIWMYFFPPSEQIQTFWGLTEPAVGFALANVVYLLVVFPQTSKKNLWVSTVFACVFTGLLAALLIETSEQSNNLYRLITSVTLFLSATAGIFVPIAGVALIWLLYIFTLLSVVDPSRTSIFFYTAWNVFQTISAYAGWRVMRKHYVRDDSRDLVKVAGMLEREQSKASLILESIGDGVITVNAQGTVQSINKSASEMLSWSKEEATGISYDQLMTPLQEGNQSGPKPVSPIATALQTSQSIQKVGLYRTKAKDTVYFDILASPIIQERPGATNTGVVVVFRDVSATRAEEKAKADFISTASHEMRTPVAAIEGYLALALNDKVSKIDDKARGFLMKAHQNTQHLGELFQDLLTTTKAEDGRLVNNPEVVEMSSFLQQLSHDLRFVAEKKGLQVDFAIGDNTNTGKVVKPLYYCMVDPTRIQEVVTNLFDNAVKYTETGRITIGITGDQSVVQCSVQDTGHGIPAEDIKHLFQKFYRVDSSVTRTIGGTGLGLFICRKIVELYGGRIWVDSEVDKGSTFYINIPRMTTQQATEWLASHKPTQPTAVATQQTITNN